MWCTLTNAPVCDQFSRHVILGAAGQQITWCDAQLQSVLLLDLVEHFLHELHVLETEADERVEDDWWLVLVKYCNRMCIVHSRSDHM